jgi:cobalt-zinc-cadmium efflux system outer membrane protein
MKSGQLWLAAWLALPACAWAQAAPPVLTLAQALQAARENVDVSLARRALAAARADISAADHAPAPVLSGKASSIDLSNGIGGGSVLGSKRIDKAIGLDWTYERGDKRQLRTRTAERNADAAQLDLDEVTVQQQLAVAAAFYDVLAAQERIVQVSAIGKSAEELSAASQRRQRAGDISQQESLRTEIESRRAQAELRAVQADRTRAALALGRLIGVRGDLGVEQAWPRMAVDVPPAPDPEQRADVLAARQRVQAAQAAFDSALALRKNDVTLGTSIDHYPGTSRRLLELRMQMPLAGLFGSYGYEGEIARARAVLDQSQDQLDKTLAGATAETARLVEDLKASASRATEFEQSIVPRARQVASMAELAYSRGALPLVDLIDARRTLRTVLLDDVGARAEYARAYAAWQLRQQRANP